MNLFKPTPREDDDGPPANRPNRLGPVEKARA